MVENLVSSLVWAIYKVWPFPVLVIGLVLVLAAARWAGVGQGGTPFAAMVGALVLSIPIATPILLFFGPRLVAPLIYHYGVLGEAVIVSSKDSGNIYNDRPVERYTVILQKADGARVETRFDSSDFNVYPARNRVRYPAVDQPFEVRYLRSHPQYFVILLEGNSPYARQLQCGQLSRNAYEARQKLKHDPENPVYQKEDEAARNALKSHRCSD